MTRSLRKPFLTTVATAAVIGALGACDGEVNVVESSSSSASSGSGSSGSGTSTAAGKTPCPNSVPQHNSPCSGDATCYYGDPCIDNEEQIATCNGVSWTVETFVSSCNPPPPAPTCPAEQPVHGDYCEENWETASDYSCSYFYDECGGIEVVATCVWGEGIWDVETPPPCNPPPPEECYNLDEASCSNTPECAWYVPEIGRASCRERV